MIMKSNIRVKELLNNAYAAEVFLLHINVNIN